ncbi:MAG: cyclic nucleotide-binding/CBS domain-containing protein, partial [Myxococcota bacterium]
MQVADIMHTEVKSANAEDTFADVAKLMRTNGISSVVVLEGKKLGGIVTERDIVNLVAAGGDPHSVKVAHGMTRRDLETIGPKMDIAEAAEHMATRNIRHLPVVDRGKVVGIVSIRDLTKWAAE